MSNEGTHKAPLEALQMIKDAEDKAKNLVQDAHEAEATKIIQTAQEEARSLTQKHIEEARATAAQKKQEIVAAAAADADKIKHNSEESTVALREKVLPLMEKAVEKTALRIQEYLKQRKI